MKIFFTSIALFSYSTLSFSQTKPLQKDTTQVKALDNVTVTAFLKQGLAQPLPPVMDMYVFAGKKATELQLDVNQANLATGIARQAFAKIPGLNIWEMDGSGTQVNIGSRSTDTHRSIEMNMR